MRRYVERPHQERITKLIDRLSENPYPSKGHPARFRARIGEYRLIYQIEESRVLVLKLDIRGDVY